MFTVTMGRSLSVLSVAAAIAVAGSAASAQVIISSDGGGIVRSGVNTVVRRAITVSDDSVRSYLTRFEPGVLDDDSGDANVVTMVLDSDGTYIRSSSRHAKVLQAIPGRVISINGDSLRTIEPGSGRIISINGDSLRTFAVPMTSGTPAVITAGSVVAINTFGRADGAARTGMLSDVSPEEIGGIATKRYVAGEMGKGPVIVTLIYLK